MSIAKVTATLLLVVGSVSFSRGDDVTPKADLDMGNSAAVAAEVDRLIDEELRKGGLAPAALTKDEDFLRRVTLDLAGSVPSPKEVTLFGLTQDENKREAQIERLLLSDEYAENWARYWRDVVFYRATEMRSRAAAPTFENWMAEKFKANASWDTIATEIITATGDVQTDGQTALIFAHMGETEEIAAEVSRIFMGIQIQCANCHDHPSDQWKRQQFHELAAFFPRVNVRRKPKTDGKAGFEVVSFTPPRVGNNQNGNKNANGRQAFFDNPEVLINRLDKNNDKLLSKDEVTAANKQLARLFDRLLERGDENKDGKLSADEIKKIPPPNNQRRTQAEHFMPDLNNPGSQGKRMDPVFFVSSSKIKTELGDLERRNELASHLTSVDNPWFAKAFVNRVWSEMLGEGFYTPVDDIGPSRQASYPEVLDLLSNAFIANKYDVKWLFRTVALTQTYQREIRAQSAADLTPTFAASTPMRLRADQLYSAITDVLGIDQIGGRAQQARGALRGGDRSPRGMFNELFGFDPSTPQDDLVGEVPQALFMMNSPILNNLNRAEGRTRLAQLLKEYPEDKDAVIELYLLVLSREPSASELSICEEFIKETGERGEAFEDIQWSLINSSEFLSKR
ncbi:MAG: DUF1549 domain-containing protein [Planctomycetota bacterium]|nr:DUF1549 domain-containing protein [Planctomycetota bacterium]MDA1214225.1 DUF1549 domain-containing protein [Planctomycetota bacterium]